MLALACVVFVVACAEAPDGEITDFSLFDAGVIMDDVPEPDAGSPAPPPADNGGMVSIPPTLDAGRDAGTAMDANTPVESGVLKPIDSGSAADTGSTTVMDAATDTGTKPPDGVVDSGPKPDAAPPSGQVCSATPGYPTTTACAKCTCTKCASQVAACYAGSDSAKCASVQACAETNHCYGENCYCGDSLFCLSANGKCMPEIESAAGSMELRDIQSAGNDANNPVGRAKAVGTCEYDNCRSECGL